MKTQLSQETCGSADVQLWVKRGNMENLRGTSTNNRKQQLHFLPQASYEMGKESESI